MSNESFQKLYWEYTLKNKRSKKVEKSNVFNIKGSDQQDSNLDMHVEIKNLSSLSGRELLEHTQSFLKYINTQRNSYELLKEGRKILSECSHRLVNNTDMNVNTYLPLNKIHKDLNSLETKLNRIFNKTHSKPGPSLQTSEKSLTSI